MVRNFAMLVGLKLRISLKCGNCGIDVPQNSQFCNVCGTKVEVSDDQSIALPKNETIKSMQEIPVTKNISKPSIFRTRNIVSVIGGIIGIIGIMFILGILLIVIASFSQGMQSSSSSVETGNSNQVTANSNAAEQTAYHGL